MAEWGDANEPKKLVPVGREGMVVRQFAWQGGLEDRTGVGQKRRRTAALQDASRGSGGQGNWIG